MSQKPQRPINVIAKEIVADWKVVNYAAVPYLEAMFSLDSIDDNFHYDSGKSVVRYFLANAQGWRGENARRIKAELMSLI
jgi:hypothetical protein